MTPIEYIRKADDPRVLVVSQRLLKPTASRCLTYEFEDVITTIDEADIVAPSTSLQSSRWRRRLGRQFAPVMRGRRVGAPRVEGNYDLLFVRCQALSDLIHLGPINRWLASARFSICYIEELWTRSIAKCPAEIDVLRGFDKIINGCQGSVEPLAQATGRPVEYLPAGIDAAAFCPFPNPPERTVDVYSMGRRSEETHEATLEFATERNLFYIYDTFSSYFVKNPAAHRRLLADIIKRSRYFIANRAKINATAQTEDQPEVGFRFFEGAAGGAVMIGDRPESPAFDTHFGWDGAVVPMPFGATNISEIVDELDANPDRLGRIRQENVRNSLLRHDWFHRWRSILQAADLQLSPTADARRVRLEQLAETTRDWVCAAA